jgi:hypothetical protein
VEFDFCANENPQAEQAAEKAIYFFIPSEARNLSSIEAQEKKERFHASLGMTKKAGTAPQARKPVRRKPVPERIRELRTPRRVK